MNRNLSKSTRALVFFTLTLILSVAGWFAMASTYGSSYSIFATKLNDKPSSYFVLNNPDRYILEAISKNYSSTFNSLDDTQFDKLIEEHSTSNIEYNGSYYAIAMAIGDKFPPFLLPQILLAGFIASIVAIVVISSYKIGKNIKSKVS